MAGLSTANMAGKERGKYEFGMNTAAIVKALREIADDLESSIAIAVSATVYRTARQDDYPETIMVLKLVESLDEKNRIAEPLLKE